MKPTNPHRKERALSGQNEMKRSNYICDDLIDFDIPDSAWITSDKQPEGVVIVSTGPFRIGEDVSHDH